MIKKEEKNDLGVKKTLLLRYTVIMWKVYKYNGHYIQGDLVSKHKTEDAALEVYADKNGYDVDQANNQMTSKGTILTLLNLLFTIFTFYLLL